MAQTFPLVNNLQIHVSLFWWIVYALKKVVWRSNFFFFAFNNKNSLDSYSNHCKNNKSRCQKRSLILGCFSTFFPMNSLEFNLKGQQQFCGKTVTQYEQRSNAKDNKWGRGVKAKIQISIWMELANHNSFNVVAFQTVLFWDKNNTFGIKLVIFVGCVSLCNLFLEPN